MQARGSAGRHKMAASRLPAEWPRAHSVILAADFSFKANGRVGLFSFEEKYMRCVVDGPRLEAFKERLPKKQTSLHRRNATRNVLDNYIADP